MGTINICLVKSPNWRLGNSSSAAVIDTSFMAGSRRETVSSDGTSHSVLDISEALHRH